MRITAKKSWVTSAGFAQSYMVSSLAPEGAGPTDSTLYLVPAGVRGLLVEGSWDGLGLRANASAPMMLDDCEVRTTCSSQTTAQVSRPCWTWCSRNSIWGPRPWR